MKKEDYQVMREFDMAWLEQGSSSILESYATATILHDKMKSIAAIAKSNVLDINSGLYQYGSRDI